MAGPIRDLSPFVCNDCWQTKPVNAEGLSTGYGYTRLPNGLDAKVCFECCGLGDHWRMVREGKHYLYLTHPTIKRDASYPFADGTLTNWPGTLSRPCRVKRGHHNIAGSRYDVWFTFNGQPWHGVQYGDNTQICRVHRLKGRA